MYSGDATKDLPPFMFGNNLANLVGSGMLSQSFIAILKINGAYCTVSLQGAAKTVLANDYAITFRFRDYFRCNGAQLPYASATFYITTYSGHDFGEMSVVLGNDNVESAHGV